GENPGVWALSPPALTTGPHSPPRRSHLPPGPTPLPFLGNVLQLKVEGMLNSDKYGPVFTVHLGPRRVVVLWGYEAVKEALEDRADEFSGRGKLAAFEEVVQGFGNSEPRHGIPPQKLGPDSVQPVLRWHRDRQLHPALRTPDPAETPGGRR
uniref:Uncharacterized protein n=1 Tax=Chelonoidis abingdonii TaxID=106734 RepID=A0A8C0JIF5_CHEAB